MTGIWRTIPRHARRARTAEPRPALAAGLVGLVAIVALSTAVGTAAAAQPGLRLAAASGGAWTATDPTDPTPTDPTPTGSPTGEVTPSPTGPAAPATISISPAPGRTGVRVDGFVLVTATGGELVSVSVAAPSGPIRGSFSVDRTAWSSTTKLWYGRRYVVTAVAENPDGVETVGRSTFTTLTPKAFLTPSVLPADNAVVGVGHPLIVRFNQPVAASRRGLLAAQLKVTSAGKPVPGAWRWTSAREVHFRPPTYWPAHRSFQVNLDLVRADAGNGVWGAKRRTTTFSTGAVMISTVDVAKHTMTVRRDGKVIKVIPVTTGKIPRFATRAGVKVIMSKTPAKVMDGASVGIDPLDPEYYRVPDVKWAMRITTSGEFVHAAPWSVAYQGRANVSHGCTGMSTRNAKWLYDRTLVGDVVDYTGSKRPTEPGNGWTDWNVPWPEWVG